MKENDHHEQGISKESILSDGSKRSGPAIKEKKTPKDSKKKQKIPKEMVLNDDGKLVSSREYLLEKTLKSTTESLNSCRTRLQELATSNANLNELLKEQEQDALQVISEMRKTNEKKDSDISSLEEENRSLKEELQKSREAIELEFEQKLNAMKSTLEEKEAAFTLVKQEHASMVEFKRKRQDLLKELEETKIELRDSEKRHRDAMIKMEKRYFEDKMKIQKEYNHKVEELSQKAHKEAVVELDETTKDVYKENVRLSEALEYHVEEGKELKRLNDELYRRNRELAEEKDFNSLIVKEKVSQVKVHEDIIGDQKLKIKNLEESLTKVVQGFEKERQFIKNTAKTELQQLKTTIDDLSARLTKKTEEMRHVKRLAQRVLDQRTEMEQFFMESLAHVREQIKKEREADFKKTQQEYSNSMKQLLRHNVPIPPLKPLKPIKRNEIIDLLMSNPKDDLDPSAKVDISDLRWTEKENILRVLFSKMNRVIIVKDV